MASLIGQGYFLLSYLLHLRKADSQVQQLRANSQLIDYRSDGFLYLNHPMNLLVLRNLHFNLITINHFIQFDYYLLRN